MKNKIKQIISTSIIVAPTGVPAKIERIIPKKAHKTEIIPEQIITPLKLLKTRIAESAGNITSADTKSEPTKFIAITITMAIILASKMLSNPVFVPLAFAKFSSNVTAKILL